MLILFPHLSSSPSCHATYVSSFIELSHLLELLGHWLKKVVSEMQSLGMDANLFVLTQP